MMDGAAEIAERLSHQVEALARELLPGGHREGQEWRCGSLAGEAGHSLGVHLTGARAGVWSDFAGGIGGDALDLVRCCFSLDTTEAIVWSRRWLGHEGARPTERTATGKRQKSAPNQTDPDRWRYSWEPSRPIEDTKAAQYLVGRGLRFRDPRGDVFRFAPRRARLSPDGILEHHPAFLALLCDFRTGEPCGIINVYLASDDTDRLRDRKAKTVTGRAREAAVMLDEFADVTLALKICEGVETGIALWMAEQRPVWALGGAGNLSAFPVLGGIECLTIAADVGQAGQDAAAKVAERWRVAGREAAIITPRQDDWAHARKAAR